MIRRQNGRWRKTRAEPQPRDAGDDAKLYLMLDLVRLLGSPRGRRSAMTSAEIHVAEMACGGSAWSGGSSFAAFNLINPMTGRSSFRAYNGTDRGRAALGAAMASRKKIAVRAKTDFGQIKVTTCAATRSNGGAVVWRVTNRASLFDGDDTGIRQPDRAAVRSKLAQPYDEFEHQ